jgi:MYXO-CTERM domain-containing protein
MRASVGAQVDYIFSTNDLYRNGLPDWAYHWGSNIPRASNGIFLHHAVKLGETGSHAAAETLTHAQDFLHFFHGQNPINMLYLSNMSALGGEHSSWQFYHAWFGASDNAVSSANFLGKPAAVSEPDYPYFKGTDNHGVNDAKSSVFGPPPGFVPGGPNKDYGGDAVPPGNAGFYNRYYRDWADQAVWSARTWEITENSIGYQGAYVALASYNMAAATLDCGIGGTGCNVPTTPAVWPLGLALLLVGSAEVVRRRRTRFR